MQISQIPPQYAPLGRALHYKITGHDGSCLIVLISDAASGSTLGAKRFNGIEEASFDAAPCLRRNIGFVPASGGTGFSPVQGRTAIASIRVTTADGSEIPLPERTFLATKEAAQAPALLTTMPRQRIIAPEESDELTFFTPGACILTLTAQAGDTTTGESYREEGEGVHVFRIDMRDFPQAESLTIDAGACGAVTYTVDRTPQRGRRLAWRTDAGSIEHYTFPVEKSVTEEVTKKRACGPDGYIAARVETEVRTALVSAFEVRSMLESLAELLSAPQVWLADGDDYTPIDVISTTAVPHRHDAAGTLEIVIRPRHKIRSPWN